MTKGARVAYYSIAVPATMATLLLAAFTLKALLSANPEAPVALFELAESIFGFAVVPIVLAGAFLKCVLIPSSSWKDLLLAVAALAAMLVGYGLHGLFFAGRPVLSYLLLIASLIVCIFVFRSKSAYGASHG